MWKKKDIYCIPEVKIELEHWTGSTMVDNLLMFIVFNAGLCFLFIFRYRGELAQYVYLVLGVMKKSVGSIYASGQ